MPRAAVIHCGGTIAMQVLPPMPEQTDRLCALVSESSKFRACKLLSLVGNFQPRSAAAFCFTDLALLMIRCMMIPLGH